MNAVWTILRQFSILINDSDLREIDLIETSKRVIPTEKTLLVRMTSYLDNKKKNK